MEPKNRVAIYIDGSNLYYKLRDVGIVNITNFDYRGFADWLGRTRPIASYRYYVGVVRAEPGNKKGQELRRNQQRLFSHLEKQGFVVKRGEIMKSGGEYHEKGVDVKIAVDLLVGAYDNLYDEAILVSSDTDLVPAIKKVRHLGKNVEYVGFSHKPSLALQRYATLSRSVIREELEKFEVKNNPKLV